LQNEQVAEEQDQQRMLQRKDVGRKFAKDAWDKTLQRNVLLMPKFLL
jgi:hypothetical protein